MTGLTGPQLWALKIIADSAPVRVSQLAARLYLHPATTSGILDRLEDKGLITRTRSVNDRRVVHVVLTDAGHGVMLKAPEVAQGLLVSGLDRLSDRKLATVAEGLLLMAKILNVQDIPPLPMLLEPAGNRSRRNRSAAL